MAKWIIIVDDDSSNLQVAGHILSRNNMRATALRSGKALIDYIGKNGFPDLILLDILMPGMDGFETLRQLRVLEEKLNAEETPVIFLTADEDAGTENHGFEAGVSDYIRKPFDPEVLLHRIGNIVSKQEKLISLKNEAELDKLTGLLNKAAGAEEFRRLCSCREGLLMMIDLDSFKLVNDIYGHEYGDRILTDFAGIISSLLPEGTKCARMGGDEFAAFCPVKMGSEELAAVSAGLNEEIMKAARSLMGQDMQIPLGASVGAALVPEHGTDFEALIALADKALYKVKKNGRHGYAIYCSEPSSENENAVGMDIEAVSAILGERSIPNVALQLDMEPFAYAYRFVMRYLLRNNRSACKLMFTLSAADGTDGETFRELCDLFGEHIRTSLRKSDLFTRVSSDRYFVLLTDIGEDSVETVIRHLMDSWHKKHGRGLAARTETELTGSSEIRRRSVGSASVAVVDDDPVTLRLAGHILSKAGYRVTGLGSGKALLEHLENELPALILLDINMPETDGFETIKRIRAMGGSAADIPVIFLTAEENSDAETAGLLLGAMDFIKKPFVPEVLKLRVRNTIELINLQRRLSIEVDKKTQENRDLFTHAVQSFADAIDAKDYYTNGHSVRVGEYSREIARRAGYSPQRQEEMYILGLLHDIGKIGVPDQVICKPSKLTDEEFGIIKKHCTTGAKILENIKEMPLLAAGARSHHERYGGGGYPDGLAGEQIPEEARIIAVADAYDAMTSSRVYRPMLSQEEVIRELEDNKGTQFDPRFADIMLEMIAEDKDFTMKES